MAKANKSKIVVVATLSSIVFLALFIGMFVWYTQTVIPHTYPTLYTNFFWGLVHGLFIVPTFFWSLFADSITIYQSPNDGNWYNLGYFIGISIIFSSSHGARGKSLKKRVN